MSIFSYTYSSWYSIPVCVECSKQLTLSQMQFPCASCCHCSHSKNGKVDTNNITVRRVYSPKFQFWNKQTFLEGKDLEDALWLTGLKYQDIAVIAH